MMKKIMVILVVGVLISCSSDSSNRNPFIPEVNFSFEVNLNLPLFSVLNTTGNAIFINNPGVGVRGVFVINSGFDTFLAWEANCPNLSPNNCSTMEIVGGTNVRCPCDDNEYSLFNGQLLSEPTEGERTFSLLNYRTRVRADNTVIISN